MTGRTNGGVRAGAAGAAGAAIVALAAGAAGCGTRGAKAEPNVGLTEARPAPGPRRAPGLRETSLAPGALLARLGAETQGPYLLGRPRGALAVVASTDGKGPRLWRAAALRPDGTPVGAWTPLGPAPEGLAITSLRPFGPAGAVLVWGREAPSGYALEAIAIGDDGRPRGPVRTVYQGAERVGWADAVGTDGGAHLYYSLQPGNAARIYVVALGEGAAPTAPALVTEGASAWQAVGAGAGSLLFEHQPKKDALGHVLARAVDAVGAPAARAETLTAAPEARADVDAAWLGDRAVAAWTQQGRAAKVGLVAVDARGRSLGPVATPLVAAGDQAFVGLAAPPGRGGHGRLLVVWDDPAARPAEGRVVQLSSLAPDLGRVTGTASLRYAAVDGSMPSLAASPDGFAALTLAPSCPAGAARCDGARPDPAFVRFDPDLRVVAAGPLLPAPLGGDPAATAWALTCEAGPCLALSATEGPAASAFVSRLLDRLAGWAPAAGRVNDAEPPFLTGVETLLRGPRPLEVVAARVADRPLALAFVRAADAGGAPKPPNRPPPGALASLRVFAPEPSAAAAAPPGKAPAPPPAVAKAPPGKAPPGPPPLTERAVTTSGLALVPSARGDAACAAFVVRDGADSYLGLARLGPDGRRQRQGSLAHAPGDVGDLDVAALAEGWAVAWVDGRDRNGEVYVARVDAELRRVGGERRLTRGGGDATEVAVLGRGDHALVAYAEPKSAAPGAPANPYVVRLRASDLSPVGEPVRLASTSRHVRSLRLLPHADGALVVWAEEPDAAGAGAGGPRLQWVRLGPDGAPRGLPLSVAGVDEAAVASLSFACDAGRCRGLMSRPEGRGRVLAGFVWAPGAPGIEAPRDLLALYGGSAADAAPAFAGDEAWVIDDEGPDGGALRRAFVRW